MCPNVGFLSKFKTDVEQIAEIEPFLALQFYSVDDIVIRTGDSFKRVGTAPLWMPELSLQVKRVGDELFFDGDSTKNFTIAVIDNMGLRRFKFHTSNIITINERYMCDIRGNVKYGMSSEDLSVGYADCAIQVDNKNDENVKLRAKWKGQVLLLNGFKGGAILVDPLDNQLRQQRNQIVEQANSFVDQTGATGNTLDESINASSDVKENVVESPNKQADVKSNIPSNGLWTFFH